MRRRGFTLIELMTVVAITGILLTLIILPVFQGFNLTRQAQAYADAQDRARVLAERISREIGNAAGIRDNSADKASITVRVPARPVRLGGPGGHTDVRLPFGKVDLVVPAEGEPEVDGGGNLVFRDPVTGKIDPTLRAPRGQINLPVAPGLTIYRYYISLRDPFADYNNPYDDLMADRGAGRDNLFVLRKAEVQPYVFRAKKDLAPTDPGYAASRALRPNLAFFTSDDATDTEITDFDDPAFCVPQINTSAAKDLRIGNWLRQSIVQTELARYDMIQPEYDRRTRDVAYDGDRPRLIPLMQFRPYRVNNEPAEGLTAVRQGEESDVPQPASLDLDERLAPDVYRTKHPGWSNPLIRTYPQGWLQTDPNRNDYLIGRRVPVGATGVVAPGFSIYGYDPDAASANEFMSGVELFDLHAYENAGTASKRYPFSYAIEAADSRSSWRSDGTIFAQWRNLFTPYLISPGPGRIIASFGITEVGDNTDATPPDNNLPTAETGPAQSPQQDNGSGAVYSGAGYEINRAFNRVWNERPELRPNIHRFVDLRVTDQTDGTDSPMHPNTGFSRARIVPGSEQIIGPDQSPGPNYGQPVRYTRTTRTPGPNQYRINYTNQQEPEDYELLGLTATEVSDFQALNGVYTPANFVSAVIQPRYRVGYVQLNSDPNVPLPVGTFSVFYRMQFTRPNDLMAVDYDTRQVMQVLVTIKNFPQSSQPNPQTVSLRATATVRNYLR